MVVWDVAGVLDELGEVDFGQREAADSGLDGNDDAVNGDDACADQQAERHDLVARAGLVEVLG